MSRNKLVLTITSLTILVLLPSTARADAILPSLVLIWPITILLLFPIVIVEALYCKPRLGMGLWDSIRVIGTANVLSSIAGLPIANLLSVGVQRMLESVYFRDLTRLQQRAAQFGATDVKQHDYMRLVLLGLYPRWILLLSAAIMMLLCFLVSWWVEARWIQRRISKDRQISSVEHIDLWRTVRNANLLSYAIVSGTVIWLFVQIWPAGLAQAIGP